MRMKTYKKTKAGDLGEGEGYGGARESKLTQVTNHHH